MKVIKTGSFYSGGAFVSDVAGLDKSLARKKTLASKILSAHNSSNKDDTLSIKFDAIISHDITYVGIIQTARASGLKEFPLPYILTNCHNSLCAVGGTINEDDHIFGLSAAKKFGGVYVPPHMAVIHQYAREMVASSLSMVLGSDSHTRYGALGCMAIGEGGGELAKQLLGRTYDIKAPQVVAVHLTGRVAQGVGPQDVALAIIKEVFDAGIVKNKVMEFVGEGVHNLSADFRIGVDVMTTETTCLSSIWETDEVIHSYYKLHGREESYKELRAEDGAYYDGVIELDLSEVRPMIAFPFHPSLAYKIEDVAANLDDIIADIEKRAKVVAPKLTLNMRDKVKDGKLLCDQALIAGCAGGSYENITATADILRGADIGCEGFSMSVYPASIPIYKALCDNGVFSSLVSAGVIVKTAFCGPCFGAGDTPSNGAFSIRHSTRNFPNREGSKVQSGQLSLVALMDARSIAATARNKGILTPATDWESFFGKKAYVFDKSIYEKRVYNGLGRADKSAQLVFGPNIKDWPEMSELKENALVKIVSFIEDEVTTTDELIPSGETSSYRSNPEALSEFTLSRRDPQYVGRAKAVKTLSKEVQEELEEVKSILQKDGGVSEDALSKVQIASTIYANKPGDGSAREQAASCQRVLGALCNIAHSYATKRYRSNLINWGMVPFVISDKEPLPFSLGDWVFIKGLKEIVEGGGESVNAICVNLEKKTVKTFELSTGELLGTERDILSAGCLINYYKKH